MALQEMLERAHCILVPVVPSAIDLHATANFLRELASWGRVRSQQPIWERDREGTASTWTDVRRPPR